MTCLDNYPLPLDILKQNRTFLGCSSPMKMKRSNSKKNIGAALRLTELEPKIEIIQSSDHDVELSNIIKETQKGLKQHDPELCEEGVNGTYFMKNERGSKIVVFKPADEEGESQFNPKSPKATEPAPFLTRFDDLDDTELDSRRNIMKSLLPGEAAQREVAAFLLDREHFYGVPATAMVKIGYQGFRSGNFEPVNGSDELIRTKIGSLQQFVDSDGSAADVGITQFPVREVHKIGILDLHIFNMDRHDGNILFKKVSSNTADVQAGMKKSNTDFVLIPIDHGFSLPRSLKHAYFVWLSWPQAKVPFDEQTREYIRRIDIDRDVAMLRTQLNIAPESLKVMKISALLLKKAAEEGLTLYEIGAMASRTDFESPSELEEMCEHAYQRLNQITARDFKSEDELFFEILEELMAEAIASRKARKDN